MPKIGPAGEIRIPKAYLVALDVGPGDYLEFEETKEGLLLRPKKMVEVDQAWYWAEEWEDRVKAGKDKTSQQKSDRFR